jgi:hypothetical protein
LINPNEEQLTQLANAVRFYPGAFQWIKDNFTRELKALPKAVGNATLIQGRCQALQELCDVIENIEKSAGPHPNQ